MQTERTNDRSTWLTGSSARCSNPRFTVALRVVLLGAPGSGKGTQGGLLNERLGLCHLSTGDLFRAARDRGQTHVSAAMAAAVDCMRRGQLVSDATVCELVYERAVCLCCPGGFALDGFPRTLAQAESLQLVLKAKHRPLHAVLDYEIPIASVVARLSGRRTCAACHATYHMVTQPPRRDGVCDRCGGQLSQREDDREECVAARMEVYERSTAPLIAFYRDLGLLSPVDATGTPDEIFRRSLDALGGKCSTGASSYAPERRKS